VLSSQLLCGCDFREWVLLLIFVLLFVLLFVWVCVGEEGRRAEVSAAVLLLLVGVFFV